MFLLTYYLNKLEYKTGLAIAQQLATIPSMLCDKQILNTIKRQTIFTNTVAWTQWQVTSNIGLWHAEFKNSKKQTSSYVKFIS
jgi:hypothetical protein